jgi:acetyltransferase-like isoleucine patch superfamily enzyme
MLDPTKRRYLSLKPAVIKGNAWLGAGAIILPGVTVGRISIVSTGDNTIVVAFQPR